jgi:hypothetical protein
MRVDPIRKMQAYVLFALLLLGVIEWEGGWYILWQYFQLWLYLSNGFYQDLLIVFIVATLGIGFVVFWPRKKVKKLIDSTMKNLGIPKPSEIHSTIRNEVAVQKDAALNGEEDAVSSLIGMAEAPREAVEKWMDTPEPKEKLEKSVTPSEVVEKPPDPRLMESRIEHQRLLCIEESLIVLRDKIKAGKIAVEPGSELFTKNASAPVRLRVVDNKIIVDKDKPDKPAKPSESIEETAT